MTTTYTITTGYRPSPGYPDAITVRCDISRRRDAMATRLWGRAYERLADNGGLDSRAAHIARDLVYALETDKAVIGATLLLPGMMFATFQRNESDRGKERYHVYAHEMTVEDHARLLEETRRLVGMVVLSGYPSALYDQALADWTRIERASLADGARPRVEVLWINPAANVQSDMLAWAGGA